MTWKRIKERLVVAGVWAAIVLMCLGVLALILFAIGKEVLQAIAYFKYVFGG